MADVNIQLPALPAASVVDESDLTHLRQGTTDKKLTMELLRDFILNGGEFTGADILALLLPVDGTGSLLDSDLLDGQHGSYYRNADNFDAGTVPQARLSAATLLTLLKTVDGTGSLLDSDLLDSQEGSYYRNASNLNAGTIPEARLPSATRRGTAKLQGAYNGVSNTVKNSFGITTVSKLSAGRYRVSFPSLGTSNYTALASCGRVLTSNYTLGPYISNKSATSFDIETDLLTGGGSSSPADVADINFSVFV